MITLRAEGGETAPAEATIERYPEVIRIGKAVAFFAGGFLLAVPCIFVPVLHLFTTWLIPIAGIVLGLRTLKIKQAFGPITGRCPLCEKPIELRGGPIKTANWRVCPECNKDLQVVVSEASATDMLE